jgi:hypothetical protein
VKCPLIIYYLNYYSNCQLHDIWTKNLYFSHIQSLTLFCTIITMISLCNSWWLIMPMHILLSYRIIFWGNSAHSKIQKRIVRIIMKVGNRDPCHSLFRVLNILPFYSWYIFSVSIFVVKNMDIFTRKFDVHSIPTRQGSDLHYPTHILAKA